MERRTTSWHSPALGMEMPLVAYGHAGYPLLMFPTAAADFLEYERFHLIDSIRHHIDAGRLRAYSINSVNRYSLMNEQAPPPVKAALLSRYDRYITDEVLPLIRHELVVRRHRQIDPHAERTARTLLLVRLFHRDIATRDVITKLIEPRGLGADQVVNFIGFLDTAVRDFDR